MNWWLVAFFWQPIRKTNKLDVVLCIKRLFSINYAMLRLQSQALKIQNGYKNVIVIDISFLKITDYLGWFTVGECQDRHDQTSWSWWHGTCVSSYLSAWCDLLNRDTSCIRKYNLVYNVAFIVLGKMIS